MNKLFLLLLFSSHYSIAQSILSNGSFENISNCPKNIGAIELATGWTKDLETPDLFSKCSKPNSLGVPANYMGHREAFDGGSYAGIFLYLKQPNPTHIAKFDYLRQEDIRTNLLTKTKYGASYEFTLWYALADSSDYYSPILTLTLSSSISDIHEKGSPVQIISLTLANSSSRQWSVAKANFVASGNWQYATIGYSRRVFSLNDYIKALRKNRTTATTNHSNKCCYYYLDNLSLIPILQNNTLRTN